MTCPATSIAATALRDHSGGRPGLSGIWRQYRRSQRGGELENALVQQHLPLVRTVVGRLAVSLPAHIDQDDLYSAGVVGLLDALRRYDPTSPASFETYARLRIRGAVLDELRRVDWVPRSVHEKARRVQAAMHRIEQRDGALPTEAEVARELGVSLKAYQELLDEIRPTTFVSLDSARGPSEDEGTDHYGAVADERQEDPARVAARRELAQLILERLQRLPDAQRKVLALYYFEDLRLREIAEAFGVTESRICQIHAQAILTLRNALRRRDPEAL